MGQCDAIEIDCPTRAEESGVRGAGRVSAVPLPLELVTPPGLRRRAWKAAAHSTEHVVGMPVAVAGAYAPSMGGTTTR